MAMTIEVSGLVDVLIRYLCERPRFASAFDVDHLTLREIEEGMAHEIVSFIEAHLSAQAKVTKADRDAAVAAFRAVYDAEVDNFGAAMNAALESFAARLSHAAQSSGNSGEVAQGEALRPEWSCCDWPNCPNLSCPCER
jgi:hypothetical protein